MCQSLWRQLKNIRKMRWNGQSRWTRIELSLKSSFNLFGKVLHIKLIDQGSMNTGFWMWTAKIHRCWTWTVLGPLDFRDVPLYFAGLVLRIYHIFGVECSSSYVWPAVLNRILPFDVNQFGPISKWLQDFVRSEWKPHKVDHLCWYWSHASSNSDHICPYSRLRIWSRPNHLIKTRSHSRT